MITKISGRLNNLREEDLSLQVGPLEYEVLIPEFTRRQLQSKLGQEVALFTIDYLEGNPAGGRLHPRLVGFLSEVEREFFELFCSVDGVGVKKALRAMVRPVREVAAAIENQDAKNLSALPGIGPASAERMIAKLRRKMPKFALLVAHEEPREADVAMTVVEEAFQALVTLGHSESDARKLLDSALAVKAKYKDIDELLRAVYQQTQRG